MKLNRRNFLFGSAAALGAIALAPYLEPLTFQNVYKKRILSAISVLGSDTGIMPMHMWIKRWPHYDSTISPVVFSAAINPKGAYRWWASDGRELIFTDESMMLLEATGCPSQVEIGGYDDGVEFVERYLFPSGSKERWLM